MSDKGERKAAIRRAVLCAKIGHSRVVDICCGYVSCGRCGAQIGDTLGGVFDLSTHVIVGHGCHKCSANAKKLRARDRYLLPPEALKASKRFRASQLKNTRALCEAAPLWRCNY